MTSSSAGRAPSLTFTTHSSTAPFSPSASCAPDRPTTYCKAPGQGGTVAGMGAQEWLIIAVVDLVLFGGSQLPKLARSLGEAQKEFKKGMDQGSKDDGAAKAEKPAKTDES